MNAHEAVRHPLQPVQREETQENRIQNKSPAGLIDAYPLFKVLNHYKPNTYYLIIHGRYLVPGSERRGGNNSIDWTPLSMLHPCTWSFSLLIGEADEWVRLRTAGFILVGLLWEHKEPGATRQMMHPLRNVSIHMDGRKEPIGGKRGLRFGSSEWEVQVDMSHPTD